MSSAHPCAVFALDGMGSTSSVAAACARTHPPGSADTNTWLVGAICVTVLYLFEKQVDQNRGDIKYWYWKIKCYGLVVLMAAAGVELVKASVYLPTIPPSSLALTNGHLVDTLWIICMVSRAKSSLSELVQCDKQLGNLRIQDVTATALFVFMMCVDCAGLGFWLVIALITKTAMLNLLGHLRRGRQLDSILMIMIGVPVFWRYIQVWAVLSQGWHADPLVIAATIALSIRSFAELQELMTNCENWLNSMH